MTSVLQKLNSSSSSSKPSSTSWLSRQKGKMAAELGLSRSTDPAVGHGSASPPSAGPSGTSSPDTSLSRAGSIAGKAKDADKDKEDVSSTFGLEPTRRKIIGAVQDEWPLYSCRPQDYEIGRPIGFGSSSVVYRATFKPAGSNTTPIPCAVKVIDVDRLSRVADIDRLRQETQLMALSKHPNVLRVRGEWIEGSKLYIACRYMSAGSVLDISRYGWPDGFEETVIATVLKQALEGLAYLHVNGWLHRDVKAANLLVDDDGTVLLADFGVSSSLFLDSSAKPLPEKLTTRKSFVGTPCWMAPEIAARKPYDSKESEEGLTHLIRITALELSCGHAPNSLFPAAKILSKTILEAPPTLDRTGGKFQYSQAMQDMVEKCLCKDPAKRPNAEKLLQHAFFKQAKKKSHLVGAILRGLPPLEERQERSARVLLVESDDMACLTARSTGRKNSLAPSDTIGSWDFNATVTSGTVQSTRHAHDASDPFSNFTSSPSGSVLLPYSPPLSPAATSASFGRVSGARNQRERSTTTGSGGGGGGHRRSVSFDVDTSAAAVASISSLNATHGRGATPSGLERVDSLRALDFPVERREEEDDAVKSDDPPANDGRSTKANLP